MANLSDNSYLRGGSYRIVRYISSGGFGCTYEAEHVMLNKRVAIKEFFPKDFCNRDEATGTVSVGTTSKKQLVEKLRRKFLDEAIALSRLEHPGIVRVTDVFEENGTAYYVMDYIDGMSLNDMVKFSGPMPEKKAVGYITQVADALKYVHEHNRLHLDIKPANIMVDKGGHAILIDFGASKQYDEENGENTSTLLGKTPGYAPLEQMGNDVVRFTPATDIYSLGATLLKLVTGKTPPSATLLAAGACLPTLPGYLSPEAATAISKSLETSRKNRPQSIDEFLKLLTTPPIPKKVTPVPPVVEKPVVPVAQPARRPSTHSDKEPYHRTVRPWFWWLYFPWAGVIGGDEEQRKKALKLIPLNPMTWVWFLFILEVIIPGLSSMNLDMVEGFLILVLGLIGGICAPFCAKRINGIEIRRELQITACIASVFSFGVGFALLWFVSYVIMVFVWLVRFIKGVTKPYIPSAKTIDSFQTFLMVVAILGICLCLIVGLIALGIDS